MLVGTPITRTGGMRQMELDELHEGVSQILPKDRDIEATGRDRCWSCADRLRAVVVPEKFRRNGPPKRTRRCRWRRQGGHLWHTLKPIGRFRRFLPIS